jgi:Domain of unknown function (DUF1905)/Bacteriocin-protection, YdeI or OmpD-Associated
LKKSNARKLLQLPCDSITFGEMKTKGKHIFEAVLEKIDDKMDTAFVAFPFDVEKIYGTKGQVKVNATFDGHPYRGVLANMGTGCHVIGVRKDIRAAINKKIGDRVKVTVEKDTQEREVDIPHELEKLLSKNMKAKSFYESLSFTNRKEYALWISSAKKGRDQRKTIERYAHQTSGRKEKPIGEISYFSDL